MRLKTFQAKSMSEAMRQIRKELGDEAIIVSSKEGPGGTIRVTAAIESLPPEFSKNAGVSPDDAMEAVTEALLRHRLPARVSDRIIGALPLSPAPSAQAALSLALSATLNFKELHGKKQKPCVLVGPPGAGKTLMTAKLAAESVLTGARPTVITTDTIRAGGIEQLQAFLDILALPLLQAADPKALTFALAQSKNSSSVIIDTGGLNPFDPQEMKGLARLLAVADMDPVLVLPAGLDAEESAEMAMTFEILGVKKLAPTRLDFARRLGGIFSAAEKTGLALTIASHTPQVANGIVRLTPDVLASFLLPSPAASKNKR